MCSEAAISSVAELCYQSISWLFYCVLNTRTLLANTLSLTARESKFKTLVTIFIILFMIVFWQAELFFSGAMRLCSYFAYY